MYNETSDRNGLLTHYEGDYFNCLEINQKELDKLFARDQKFWEENLSDSKQTLDTYRDSLKALLERQTKEIEQMLEIDTS